MNTSGRLARAHWSSSDARLSAATAATRQAPMCHVLSFTNYVLQQYDESTLRLPRPRQKMELLFKGFGWYWSISRWRFQGILWDDMNRGYKLLYCKEYFKAFSSFFSDKTWGKCIMQHSHDMFTSMFTTTTFLVLSVLYSENLWLAGIISCILYK